MLKLSEIEQFGHISVDDLFAIKGGYGAKEPPVCDSKVCNSYACDSAACSSNTCNSMACGSSACDSCSCNSEAVAPYQPPQS